MSGSPLVRLSDVATYRKEFITIDDSVLYKRCRVQLHRKGVVLRDEVLGKDIKTKRQRVCHEDDFLVAEMDAKFGGYGIVPHQLVGAVVSSHYYLFKLNPAKISPEYLSVLIDTDIIQRQIQAKGSTNYSRISPTEVGAFEIPCPTLDVQHQIVERYATAKITVRNLLLESDQQFSLLTQLRQAILQEAIEGRLTAGWRRAHPVVKGDPETDAGALLAQIQAEKARLVAEGTIKKPKPLAPIREDEVPFALPEGWVWTRLGKVADAQDPNPSHRMPKYEIGGVPFISPVNVGPRGEIDFDSGKKVSGEILDYQKSLFELQKHSFAFSRIGTIGMVFKLPTPQSYCLSYSLSVITPIQPEMEEFLMRTLSSPVTLGQATIGTTMNTIPDLGMSTIRSFCIPLPPLAEQRVIVERVERLLAMVDELEQQVIERKRQAEALLQTVLAEAFGESAKTAGK